MTTALAVRSAVTYTREEWAALSDDERGPCDEWPGPYWADGYGRVGSKSRAHREAWIESNGPIPPETPCVLHHCDNRPCRRADHLFLGTRADNIADMVAKGRQRTGNPPTGFCGRGHEFTPENTKATSGGERTCRICYNAAMRAWRGRNPDYSRQWQARKRARKKASQC